MTFLQSGSRQQSTIPPRAVNVSLTPAHFPLPGKIPSRNRSTCCVGATRTNLRPSPLAAIGPFAAQAPSSCVPPLFPRKDLRLSLPNLRSQGPRRVAIKDKRHSKTPKHHPACNISHALRRGPYSRCLGRPVTSRPLAKTGDADRSLLVFLTTGDALDGSLDALGYGMCCNDILLRGEDSSI